MPPRTLLPASLLGIKFKVFGKWRFENGKPRKLDLQNLEKILIDAIAERYDFDDARIWEKESIKVEAKDDAVECVVRQLAEQAA